jgi:hypothetical protein
MNTAQQVVMPQSAGINQQWQEPDLGGKAFMDMADSVSKSMTAGANSLTDTLKERAGTHELLVALSSAKDSGGNPLFDPKMMDSILKGSAGAQQKFLGLAASHFADSLKGDAQNNQETNLLKWYRDNQWGVDAHNMIHLSPGQRGPTRSGGSSGGSGGGGNGNVVDHSGAGGSDNNQPTDNQPAGPKFTAPSGWSYSDQTDPMTGRPVKVLHDSSGTPQGIYDPQTGKQLQMPGS